MNGKSQNLLSFVGAMKIARNVPVSDRHDEWYSPTVPGSLSEGAAERSEAEGVSFDGSSGPMVTRKPLLSLKFLSGYEHQSTPPGLEPGTTPPITSITRPLDVLPAGG